MSIHGIKDKAISFKYTIRHSQRAKKIRIIVTPEKVEIVAPVGVPEGKIRDFARANQDWVKATSLKVKAQKKSAKKLAPDRYIDGVFVPFRGSLTRIRLKQSLSKKVEIKFDKDEFTIFLPISNFEGDNAELIRSALIDWMKNQAYKDMLRYVKLYADKYNLHPRYVRVKTQKSRWGSCGIHNDININWLLILAPPEVMAYVVVHELCHIKERNHSSRFWQLVGTHFPDYQKQRNWLRQNGSGLAL